MHQVVCFGEILWDNFKEGKKAGGAPMNVALHLHKQGIKSAVISSVGRDSNGEELLEFLQRHHLPAGLVQRHPSLPTGIVEVELDEKQQATYTIVEPVAWDEIQAEADVREQVEASEALVFGSLACRNEVSRNTLLQLLPLAKLKIFDMNIRPPHFREEILKQLMLACDVLKINEDELVYVKDLYSLADYGAEEALLELNRILDIPTICVTLGDKGAMVLHDGRVFSHAGYRVQVADTVGAGDAFLAAFIRNYLQGFPMEQTLERACAGGALVASKAGANPDYSEADIADIISEGR